MQKISLENRVYGNPLKPPRKNSIVDVAATMGILGDLFPKYKKPRAKVKRNPARAPAQADLNAAARGLRMQSMDADELRSLAHEFRAKGTFTGDSIAAAAEQLLKQKVRLGLLAPPTRAKRNPASGVRIVHNKLLGGWFIVTGPYQSPIGGRFASREAAQQHLIDAKNRRDDHSPKYRRNPASGAHRSTATGPHWLVYESRNGGRTWMRIARFETANKGEHHAKEYARALYRKNPHLGYTARMEK